MNKILPPTYLLSCIIIAIALHYLLPCYYLLEFPYRYLGIPLILIGLWLNIWADGIFKRAQTTVKPLEKPSALTTHGPFKFTRNPMYLGMVIGLIGLAVVLGSVTPFLVPLIFYLIVVNAYMPHEEKYLEEVFGPRYLEYKRHVRRWL